MPIKIPKFNNNGRRQVHRGSAVNSPKVLNLVNASCPQLPQDTAISDMLPEARALSQIQLAETLLVTKNNTLHSDGTTKFGQKYTSYQISTNDKALTLGVQVLR